MVSWEEGFGDIVVLKSREKLLAFGIVLRYQSRRSKELGGSMMIGRFLVSGILRILSNAPLSILPISNDHVV